MKLPIYVPVDWNAPAGIAGMDLRANLPHPDSLRPGRGNGRASTLEAIDLNLQSRLMLLFLIGLFVSLGSTLAMGEGLKSTASSTPAQPGASDGVVAGEEHGLSAKAVEIARPFGFPITNSMVVTWIVALGLIVFAQFATRNMKQVPAGAQNFWSGWWRPCTNSWRASSARIW